MILTEREAQKQLQSSNRDYYGRKTWEQQYGNIDVAKQQAESGLTYDYAKELGQAYSSAMQSEQAILGDKYSTLNKPRAIQSIDQALQEAYDAYLQNYQKGISNIEKSASEATSQITKNLETEAKYIAQLTNAPYEYLQYMFKQYGANAGPFTSQTWSRYINPAADDVPASLKSLPEILGTNSDINIQDLKYQEFYDQMLNEVANLGQYESFDTWLSSSNKKLYDWLYKTNLYDSAAGINPVTGQVENTNLGSFKNMIGLAPTDYKYSFAERYGAFTKDELQAMFDKYKNIGLEGTQTGKGYTKYINELNTLVDDVQNIAKELGIYDTLSEDLGGWDNFKNVLNEYKDALTTGAKEKANVFFENIGAFGLNIGKFLYNLVAKDKTKYRTKTWTDERNEQVAKDAENAYLDMINSLISYAEAHRQEVQKL